MSRKRLTDLLVCLAMLPVCVPLMLVVALAVRLTSRGPVLYWSERVGRDNRLFAMPKFRSMRTDAPQVATHQLADSAVWITPVGRLIRATSLDELPQLWSVLRGDMSLVGPRPALFNQHDLIALRTAAGVSRLQPGVTGWAQVNGRDTLSIPAKVEYDVYYLQHQSLMLDLRIMVLTLFRVARQDGVQQADSRTGISPAPASARSGSSSRTSGRNAA